MTKTLVEPVSLFRYILSCLFRLLCELKDPVRISKRLFMITCPVNKPMIYFDFFFFYQEHRICKSFELHSFFFSFQ